KNKERQYRSRVLVDPITLQRWMFHGRYGYSKRVIKSIIGPLSLQHKK
ncbi:MAG: hypothetical protein ACI8RD_012382, partial [Bacillariaceae sp.]